MVMSLHTFLWMERCGYPRVGAVIMNGRMEGFKGFLILCSLSISHRSNYAWDLGALNSNMMSYSNYGTQNTDFEVFQKTVILPMNGRVVTLVREVHFSLDCGNLKQIHSFQEIDNDPDIDSAVELADHENGSGVDLEEKPQNMVELEIGGEGSPFLLRLLHLKQNSIPSDIKAKSIFLRKKDMLRHLVSY